jgi:hypothetical protein
MAMALGACWTSETVVPPPAPVANAAAEPPPPRSLLRPRPTHSALRLLPPPSLTPAQRRFPPDLRAMRGDAYACAQAHGASITHLLAFEVTVDRAGAVTAARVTGFGPAEPCVLAAIRARTFVEIRDTTVTLTIPWMSAHPPAP